MGSKIPPNVGHVKPRGGQEQDQFVVLRNIQELVLSFVPPKDTKHKMPTGGGEVSFSLIWTTAQLKIVFAF